jgi:hypothetical protein
MLEDERRSQIVGSEQKRTAALLGKSIESCKVSAVIIVQIVKMRGRSVVIIQRHRVEITLNSERWRRLLIRGEY